ncbi:sensor histidine kinase [Mucilaginibacter sp. OK283]|uniref:sensor histidine kinase n=1 Tax=Mucilaginibacter sp. OK283 TaxID=1881049 RepID=UPI0008B77216|nr:sensor histidine kinase [Mucilaginibacter sp. OK283]SEO62016.1 Histidine kinase [Mucilaginibacter sp. OK283]
MSKIKAISIILHFAGWVMLMAIPLIFLHRGGSFDGDIVLLQSPDYWLFGLTFMVVFYSNAYFFVPRLLLRKKHIFFGIAVFSLFFGVYCIRPFDRLLHIREKEDDSRRPNNRPPFNGPGNVNYQPVEPPGRNPNLPSYRDRPLSRSPFGQPLDITSFFIFFTVIAFSTAIKTIREWLLTEQRAARAEADKATAELSFLKAQINPHFLFNTMNNIYTLVLTRDDHAADSVLRLSKIMRYVTEDVTGNFAPLQREVDCIASYIELQRLRTGNLTAVNFEVDGDIDGKQIAPLLLMTFIENVFKYGVSKHESTTIQIKLVISETALYFYCKNRIFGLSNGDNHSTGIGIKNTRKRLEHLYTGRYLLNISNDNQEYIVQLTLPT